MTKSYEHPFLTSVIVRVDFTEPLTEVTSELPQELHEACLRLFPIPEPRTGSRSLLTVNVSSGSGPSIETEKTEVVEHLFHDKRREKTLRLGDNAMWITYSKYGSFDELKYEVSEILK